MLKYILFILGKSPIPYHAEKLTILPEVPKSIFIPRKPPEESEKHLPKLSEGSNTVTFEYAAEFLQQRIKTEDHSETLEVNFLFQIIYGYNHYLTLKYLTWVKYDPT